MPTNEILYPYLAQVVKSIFDLKEIQSARLKEENMDSLYKNIEIKGNLDTVIFKNENRTVKEDKKDVIEGSYELSSSKGINEYTQEHIVLQADNYIDIKSKSNLTTNTDSQHTEVADSKFSDIKSNYEVDAGNQIIHQVGSTQIEITSSNVIIRAGGVEAIFNQRGITVIGGEVRAE